MFCATITFICLQLLEEFGEDLLPDKHPAYARVARVANRILRANRDLQQVHGKDWTITVVNSDIKNAFVLPVRKKTFFLNIKTHLSSLKGLWLGNLLEFYFGGPCLAGACCCCPGCCAAITWAFAPLSLLLLEEGAFSMP